jgi:hypothetical protein
MKLSQSLRIDRDTTVPKIVLASLHVLTWLYLLFLVVPLYGSTRCAGCPALDLGWYPLMGTRFAGFRAPDLAGWLYLGGTCIGPVLLLVLLFDFVANWDFMPRRGKIIRLAISIPYIIVVLMTYVRVGNMGGWFLA